MGASVIDMDFMCFVEKKVIFHMCIFQLPLEKTQYVIFKDLYILINDCLKLITISVTTTEHRPKLSMASDIKRRPK